MSRGQEREADGKLAQFRCYTIHRYNITNHIDQYCCNHDLCHYSSKTIVGIGLTWRDYKNRRNHPTYFPPVM